MSLEPLFESERLAVRPLAMADAPFILRLVNDPGWLRFIGDRGIHTLDAAGDYIRKVQEGIATLGFGLWLVQLKTTAESLGICGLLHRDYLDEPDLGFAFTEEHSGCGYATESGAATLRHAIPQFELACVAAITTPDHERSLRVLHKLGFQRSETIAEPSDGGSLQLLTRVSSAAELAGP